MGVGAGSDPLRQVEKQRWQPLSLLADVLSGGVDFGLPAVSIAGEARLWAGFGYTK